ncbi:MAG TPA: hypothetical protein VGB04_07415 [Allosphingosinicella sp.]|jgi:hypothetical protein
MERPKAKPNVRWRVMERGLLVTHGDDGFVLPNPKVAAIAEKLVGEIDGRRTAPELEAALPERARPLMAAILSQMAEKGMLVEAPRGLVAAEVVESGTGLLALTIGGDWEERLRTWSETGISISGPDAGEVDNLARQVVEAGGRVASRGGSDRIEIRATARATVVVAETRSGTVIGTADPGHEAEWPGSNIPLPQGKAEERPQKHERRMIVSATIVRHALLAALAPDAVAGKVVVVDGRGLASEFDLEADNPLGIASVERPDPLADTSEWLNDASPLAAGVDVEPAFPLAHRTITLKGNGDEPETVIIEWGLSPREADERALGAALAELAARSGIEARSEDEAEKQGHGEPRSVVPDDLDGRAALLWRVSELYTGRAPAVRAVQRAKGWTATATLGEIRGDGAGVDKGEAVASAIGNALSKVQTGMAPTGQAGTERNAT